VRQSWTVLYRMFVTVWFLDLLFSHVDLMFCHCVLLDEAVLEAFISILFSVTHLLREFRAVFIVCSKVLYCLALFLRMSRLKKIQQPFSPLCKVM
jgi:uncharacterized membrane protein